MHNQRDPFTVAEASQRAINVLVVGFIFVMLAFLCQIVYGVRPAYGAELYPRESCTLQWVIGLDQAPVEVPCTFAKVAISIVQCESGYDPSAIGDAGERGSLQIHPIHRKPMAEAGLRFGWERDRWLWAVRLWREHGFKPWSCYE